MSLTMMALRIAAVQALKAGGTLVGENVLDSQISAIDQTTNGQLRSDQQKPFIAVYTDAARAQDLSQTGLRTNGRVEIVFNCGVALTMAQTNKNTGAAEIIEGFPATDANFEAILDVLEVQIGRTLTDPDNAWSQVFAGFIKGYVSKDHVRSSSAAENVRLAAGQTKLTVDVFADPIQDQALSETGPWRRFLALLSDQDAAKAERFSALLGQPGASLYPAFERLMGMASSDARALKLYSFDGLPLDLSVTGVTLDGA
ncbi:hypothetical protein FHS89_001790 [Rubricella aquisinus]|uniref:Uncharacterized protein n=1 Tax=Rubricella aquisinus TaxID=2028108 RepID=A0A840WX64_9RHOB|nr:hypothetical protein [Rubricella aquisinus]MBB5515770.1 hypothetical protein [Rubricella aquisinus]